MLLGWRLHAAIGAGEWQCWIMYDGAVYQCVSLQLLTSKYSMSCLWHVSTCVTHPPDREQPSWDGKSLGQEWRLQNCCQPRMDKILYPCSWLLQVQVDMWTRNCDLYIYLLFIYVLSISLNYSESTTVTLIGGSIVWALWWPNYTKYSPIFILPLLQWRVYP